MNDLQAVYCRVFDKLQCVKQ